MANSNAELTEIEARFGTIILSGNDIHRQEDLSIGLRDHGYAVVTSVSQGLLERLLGNQEVEAVLLDSAKPSARDIETLKEIRRHRPKLPVILLSDSFSPSDIVNAVRAGASDFLPKPVSHWEIHSAIERARADSFEARRQPSVRPGNVYYGCNLGMQEIHSLLPTVGGADVPVLILGETGTGKEALARQLHSHSHRGSKTLVKINCAAVPSELVESELFGHEKGAFTGAVQRKIGLFEMAHGSTILLDEIGDMEIRVQAKLLQVLQDHEFWRVGGREPIRVDVRVIAATHRDLEKAIAAGTFREDLYYRLNVCSFVVPALRDRKEDIEELAKFLLRKHGGDDSILALLTTEVLDAMYRYEWPGNIRELENVMRKLMTLRDPDLVARELRLKIPRTRNENIQPIRPADTPSRPTLGDVSRAAWQAEAFTILETLDATRWNRRKAAVRLGMDYKALLYKMKKLNISCQEEESGSL